MKKTLQFLSVFVPLSLAFAAFIYCTMFYGEYMFFGAAVIFCVIIVASISASIAGSIYADKTLKDEDKYLW